MTERDAPRPALLAISDAVPASRWIWQALGEPVVLLGMAEPPPGFDVAGLADRGVGAVVSLIGPRTYDVGPLQAYAFRLADLYGGLDPDDLASEEVEVGRAAQQVLELVDDGVGVAVHCRAGIGRTSTVIGAVLVAMGHPVLAVVAWLDAVQKARGAPGWPEAAWQETQLDVLVR